MGNKVDVVLGGEKVTLKSDETKEYLQKLATYIDKKNDEIKARNVAASIDDRVRTLLLSFNMSDELHKEKDEHGRLKSVHQRFVLEMGKMQDDMTRKNEESKQQASKIKRLEEEDRRKSEHMDRQAEHMRRQDAKLEKLDAESKKTIAELASTKAELATTKEELVSTKEKLVSTKADLDEFIQSFDANNNAEGENIISINNQSPTNRKAW
ncbi:MAG: cell division protein ZapA [Defluviitaleaceae bacterium]|nr:cell division protein ZapA [Defluviitaleaceae bacterium]